MKKVILLALSLVVAVSTQTSMANLLAGWDFATLTNALNGTAAIIPATVGAASLDVSTFNLGTPQGTNPERTSFGGDILNAFPGGDATAGQALALANVSANGKAAVFSLSTVGFQDLVLTFATRGTGTGFNSHAWSWSTDNVTYTPLTSIAANQTATWLLETVDFSAVSAIENATAAYLMLTVTGATSASGNNRIDNIQINAVAVPEPSAMALLGGFGLLGLMMASRRRS